MRKWLTLLLCCIGCAPAIKPAANENERWAIYYDKKVPAEMFKNYDLVVFDRTYYPDFKKLKGKTTVLAYVSAGEVHDTQPVYKTLVKKNALLGKQEHWNSYIVDLGVPEWRDAVLAQVDDAMKKGFDGVMLDTIDSPIVTAAKKSPKAELQAQADAVKLIVEIRLHYPHAKLMLNRGFSILPVVAPAIDYALAESTLVQTDISTGQSSFFPPNSYQFVIGKLEEARMRAPGLKIYTLDYWNQDDVQGLHKIYATQRAQGFSPYVSTLDLRHYTPEPVDARNASSPTPVKEEAAHA